MACTFQFPKFVVLRYDINTLDLRYVPSLCDEKDIVKVAKTVFVDMMNILTNAAQANDTAEINIPTVCDTMMNHNGTKVWIISSRNLSNNNFSRYEYFI